MICRALERDDLERVARWNRQLQADEGAKTMTLPAIERRLRGWLDAQFEGLVFELDSEPVGYALFRPTDPDLKEPGGVYLRQFFIDRDSRRRGLGTAAFELFVERVVRGRRLVLEVLATNPVGQAFWRARGLGVYSTTLELRAADTGAHPSPRRPE